MHKTTGRRLGYGELAKAAAGMPLPESIRLKDPSAFRYIGTGALKLVDAQDMVAGTAQYACSGLREEAQGRGWELIRKSRE